MSQSPEPSPSFDFLVRKGALGETRVVPAAEPDAVALGRGQILARVDKFALTSNNITYAVFGDVMQYWDFYPAPEGWGRIPVWGYADVARSEHPAISVGERLFGYWPMSTWTTLEPADVVALQFRDASSHRQHLPPFYNVYTRVAADPGYDPALEPQQMLLRVLFLTSFLIDDFLANADFFGARAVVIASASSKTAISLAHCLHSNRSGRVEVIGLTSARHADFVAGLGCYDRTVTYDALTTLPQDTPAVYVDMAGNAGVTATVHRHLGDALRYSCVVGGTHWDRVQMGQELPGPTPVLFFAPAQVAKRAQDWGPVELERRMATAWLEFVPHAKQWIRIESAAGSAEIERVYREMLAGRTRPDEGWILSPGAR